MADQTPDLGEKREVKAGSSAVVAGFSIQDLILIAVLLAAGAVLKLTVATFFTIAGMRPNFIIAAYCLAIALTRAKPLPSAIIGLLAGLICQLPMMAGTPWLNLVSEPLGGLAMGLLFLVPMHIGKFDAAPAVSTFVATVVSGATYALLAGLVNGMGLAAILAAYGIMVLATAVFNAVLVAILYIPLKSVLKR